VSLWLLGFRIAKWNEENFELNWENLKKSGMWEKVKSDMDPAGRQNCLSKVPPKKIKEFHCER